MTVRKTLRFVEDFTDNCKNNGVPYIYILPRLSREGDVFHYAIALTANLDEKLLLSCEQGLAPQEIKDQATLDIYTKNGEATLDNVKKQLMKEAPSCRIVIGEVDVV